MKHTTSTKLTVHRFLQYTFYPVSVLLAMWVAFSIASTIYSGQGIIWLPFLELNGKVQALILMFLAPLTIAIPVLIIGERLVPLTKKWRPSFKENVSIDLLLFSINNLIFRADVIVTVSMAFVAGWGSKMLGMTLWPVHQNLVFQLIFFLVLSEFTTYWYHRLAHHSHALWRFHCVHHNPRRLYFFNGTRFHYLDMIMIPLVGNLPAIALGAPTLVIELGAVFSIIHGMWQHANIDVRMGFLNHILSSPQHHRWHHSRIMKQANTNFGNNLIIWDTLFKTRYLPDLDVRDSPIGVSNMSSTGVLKQILMPVTLKKNTQKTTPLYESTPEEPANQS